MRSESSMGSDAERDASLTEAVACICARDGEGAGASDIQEARPLVSGTLYASSAAARPTCSRCRRPWRWPRNIAYKNLVCDVPERIKPTTKATVVAHLTAIPGSKPARPTICTALFRRLELLHTPDNISGYVANRVTHQFLYHPESGYVNYDVKQQEQSGLAFARLITLNSWYMTLFKCLMVVMFTVLDHQANLLLVIQLFTQTEDQMVIDFGEAKYPFGIGWLVMLVLTLLVAGRSAWLERRTKKSHIVGDWIPQCGLFDEAWTYLALTCFAFFSVEHQVKDIVILLHPWKSIQPFCAFKSDGVRAYVVGYLDEYLWKVENQPFFYALFAQLLMRTFVFVFKTYRLVLFPSPVLVASVCSSVGSVCWGWRTWLVLYFARRKLKLHLLRIINECVESSQATEHWQRQRDAAKKLLTTHFRFRAREHHDSSKESFRAKSFSPLVPAKPECPSCGRDLDTGTDSAKTLPSKNLEIGSQVRLSDRYLKFHDAKYGPLQLGDIGEVVEIGPEIPICGARRLVRAGRGGGGAGTRTWWYDEGAVECVDPSEGGPCLALEEGGPPKAPPPTPAVLQPAASGESGGEGSELTEELRRLLGRLQRESPAQRRAHAAELLRAAEALARGQEGGADVLRLPSFDSDAVSPSPDPSAAETLEQAHEAAEVPAGSSPGQPLPGVVEEAQRVCA